FIGCAARRPMIMRQIKIRNYLAMCLQQRDSCDAQRARRRRRKQIAMIEHNRIPKEIDMSKTKKTKAPKVIKDAALKTPKSVKRAASNTRKVKSAAEPKSNKTTQM